jgi:hypothetical protein
LLVRMTRIWPGLLDISRVVKPETILRWHRSGFKAFWRWKSRYRAGRPKVDREPRDEVTRHPTAKWPKLLNYCGLPSLQVINRAVHLAKCAIEARFRAGAAHQ